MSAWTYDICPDIEDMRRYVTTFRPHLAENHILQLQYCSARKQGEDNVSSRLHHLRI